MLIICAIYFLFYNYDAPVIWDYVNIAGTCILLLAAAIVTLRIHADVQFSAGLMGAALGVMIICKMIGGLISASLGLIALGIIGCAAGFLCLMFSFPIYCGSKYDTKRISIVLLIYCALILLVIVVEVAFENVDFVKALDAFKLELMTMIPALIYIWFISNSEISYRDLTTRVRDNLDSIEDFTFDDKRAFITREYLKDSTSRWYTVESGYIRKQMSIPIHLDHNNGEMIIEYWYDGTYWGMIVNENKGTIIQSFRFQILQIVPNGNVDTCDRVTIYTVDGYFIRLAVKDNSEGKELTKKEKASRFFLGY